MGKVTAAAHASPRTLRIPRQASATEAVSNTAAPRTGMRRVRRIGYAVLAVQLLGFGAWSALLYHRFALTWDFAVYDQPWYLIAHGHLDPRTSIENMPFWRNDAEFALWPLAPLWWLWPHGVVLLWVQDIGVVAAEALAFGWMCELAGRVRHGRWLAGTGLVLLVACPWIWWSVSFDFHMESVAIPFAVLLARDLASGRRRMWVWLLPILISGAPAAVYVLGIGLGGILAGRRYWAPGAALALSGVAWSGLVVVLHADNGAPLARHYGYLAVSVAASYAHGRLATGTNLTTGQIAKGILEHPLRVAQALWDKRTDVAADLLPGGLAGFAWRPLLPFLLVGLLSAVLSAGWRFAQPSFQALPIYVLLPVGTVAVLAWLAERHRKTALILAGFMAAQVALWAAVWAPQVPVHWLRVPAPVASSLRRMEALIPASAEVNVSQGVLGPFSDRVDVHALVDSGRTPVDRPEAWFVVAPSAGTELETPASAMAFIGQLAGPMHATLIAHSNGVWLFRWHRPAGQHLVRIPDGLGSIPAWAAAGAAGRASVTATVAGWHTASTGRKGYVADGMTWLEPPGVYRATVRLSSSGPVNVEVWDDNGDRLMARHSLSGTSGVQAVSMPLEATTAYHAGVFSGWGPFRATFVPPLPGQHLEVRVWSPGGDAVNVYSASLTAAG